MNQSKCSILIYLNYFCPNCLCANEYYCQNISILQRIFQVCLSNGECHCETGYDPQGGCQHGEYTVNQKTKSHQMRFLWNYRINYVKDFNFKAVLAKRFCIFINN